jgi:hypothetical protein
MNPPERPPQTRPDAGVGREVPGSDDAVARERPTGDPVERERPTRGGPVAREQPPGARPPAPGESAVDRVLEATATTGGPQVYSLPDAPSAWGTAISRAQVTDAVDPGRAMDDLDNVDALGPEADRDTLEQRRGRNAPADDLARDRTVSGETLPLQRTGATDAKGHRYPGRDPGLGRSVPPGPGSKSR